MFTRRKRYNKRKKTTKKTAKKNFRIYKVERNSKMVNKKKTHINNRKHKRYHGGNTGNWFTYDELPEDKKDDKCPICHDYFRETTDKVIYKTDCGHLFHNNCLNDYCNHIGRNNPNRILNTISCPICGRDLGYACIDVDAFQDKFLEANLSDKVREIYESER
jgi:Ring finger domain